MARTQARIHSSIWTDPDWKALGRGAKLTYVLLLSQPTLSLAGCLDYMPERWAKYDADTDEDEILEDVEELERAGFVVVDWETYEVLIRTFPANDLARGALNANLIKGMWAAWAAILSPVLRRALLDNLPAEIWEKVDKDNELIRPRAAEAMRAEPAIEAPSNRGQNGGSDGGSNLGSDGEPNHLLSADCSLLSAPADSVSSLALVPSPTARRSTGDSDFDRFWSVYPRRDDKLKAQKAWKTAITKADPDTIIAGAARHRDDPNRELEFTKLPATWLNAGSWSNGPLPRRGGAPQINKTDAKVAAILNRAQA